MGRKDKPISLEDSDNLPIGSLMRQSRQTLGISLSHMAQMLDFSRGYLSMIENGSKQPPYDLVIGYERVLGLEDGSLSQVLQPQQKSISAIEQRPSSRDHVDLLRQGVDLWNLWREDHPEICPYLARAYFGEVNLSGANLSGADLTRADLSWARLSKADLSGAILRQVHISGAILSEANLSRAYLNGAKLFNANLSEANLSEANLSGADLSNANLSGADLSNANLSGANLSMVDLSGSNLARANLTGANLIMADLNKVTVTNTVFGNVDLRQVRGLEAIQHVGPSVIGLDTILRSEGNIPEVFLREAGVNDTFITYLRSLTSHPIETYNYFISYSSKDQEFAEQLYADLQSKGIRCWFAPEDLKIGDKFRSSIDEAIKLSDKLIVVLSKYAVESSWVAMEVEAALEKEQRQKRLVLYPIRLDDTVMLTPHAWATDLRRTRHFGDFEHWKEPGVYQKAFRRLLRDLKTPSRSSTSRDMALLAEHAVFRWFERSDYQLEPNKGQGLDFFITDKDGNKVGVEVKFYTDPRTAGSSIAKLYHSLENMQVGVNKFLVVTTFPDESTAHEASAFLRKVENVPSNISLTLGYIQHNEFQEIGVD